jgi:hypothetical protein
MLCQVGPDGINELRSLPHEQIARPKGSMPAVSLSSARVEGRVAASTMASASAASFFCRLTKGFT